jgi:cytochrome oxidase Cu insertion factor (SCO1/SenC/PrrC family)
MALAATNPHADPILNEAIDGTPESVDLAAAPFTLTDQNSATVSLQSLRGRVIALTFLDPVCTTDCPLIAQEFHDADRMLGAQSQHAVFIAIVANPVYDSVAITRAFDQTEGLSGVKNWLFLTGPEATLKRLWSRYGVQVSVEPAGAMVAHSDIAFVIDSTGHTRYVLDADPGPGTAASQSSFSGVVTTEIQRVLGAS